jgi:hypothetical protein
MGNKSKIFVGDLISPAVTKTFKGVFEAIYPVDDVKDLLDAGAKAYTDSPSTTNAGFILRLFCRIFKPSTIIKMFAHKMTK